MNRSPVLASLRAFVALAVALLQLVGALHFSLVRHSYSAALGGVVHVHTVSLARSEAPRPRAPEAPAVSSDTPSCSADACTAANAPHSVAPELAALDAGAITFGDARLLSERVASPAALRRALLGAPKTSPPV